MRQRKSEGAYYAEKDRLYQNEYSGTSLEGFCKADNISYNKTRNWPYRKGASGQRSRTKYDDSESVPLLPEMDLKPLVIDMDEDGQAAVTGGLPCVKPAASRQPAPAYLSNVHIRTSGRTEISIGKCPANALASLVKELEGVLC